MPLKENIKKLSPIIDNNQTWTLIYGTSPQKNLHEMLDYVSQLCSPIPPNKICLTKPLGGRYPGVDTSILAQYQWPIDEVKEFDNAEKVLDYLSQYNPSENGLVVSLGSLYLQGNILNYLGNPIGKSIKEDNCESIIEDIFKTAKNYSCKIIYPEDVVVGKNKEDKAQIKELNEVNNDHDTVNQLVACWEKECKLKSILIL